MPLPALLLILASGIVLAVWNLLVKKAEDASVFFLGAIITALALYTPVFLLLLVPGLPPLNAEAVAAVFLAGLIEGTYFILLTVSYRRGDLSLVYPVSRGSAPLFIVAGAAVFLSERVTLLGYAGIGLIVLGIAAVAWPTRRATVTGPAVALSLLTGVAIAGHHVCYKWALGFLSPFAAIYMAWLVAGTTLGVYCLVTRPWRSAARYLHANFGRAALVGVISMAGFLCALVALNMTLVSYVGAARNVGMIFSVIFGALFLKEGGRLRRLVGAVAITAGVFAIAFA
ncbi:MAG: DMT family transporter [Candidatus Zixiibacteriota bacterium]|jgi:drug/metabolite transporter (DMT)-like permease